MSKYVPQNTKATVTTESKIANTELITFFQKYKKILFGAKKKALRKKKVMYGTVY